MAFWQPNFWTNGFWRDGFWEGMFTPVAPSIYGSNAPSAGGGGSDQSAKAKFKHEGNFTSREHAQMLRDAIQERQEIASAKRAEQAALRQAQSDRKRELLAKVSASRVKPGVSSLSKFTNEGAYAKADRFSSLMRFKK